MTKRKKRRARKQHVIKVHEWLRGVEHLIAEHTTPPRKRGKYKGHGSTDSVAWVIDLVRACRLYIKGRNRGIAYDENMAIASLLGLILCAWYAQVHRAKALDPNRPLSRRGVFTRLARWRATLAVATTDERIMGRVWGLQQAWNFPFGRGAKGGRFV